MSINPVEERLFLALDAIEKLTERAEQSQATIEKLQITVAEQQQTIVTVADNKMTEIDTTYKHVNEVMFQSIYQAISKNVRPMIEDEVHQAIKNNIVRIIIKFFSQKSICTLTNLNFLFISTSLSFLIKSHNYNSSPQSSDHLGSFKKHRFAFFERS